MKVVGSKIYTHLCTHHVDDVKILATNYFCGQNLQCKGTNAENME